MTRLAIVTGVLGGVGRATAAAFHDAGWRVIGIDREAAEIPADCDELWHLDIAANDTADLGERIAAVGPIDALVNNAAIQIHERLVDTPPADWDLVAATNLRAPYLLIRYAHAGLRQAHGAVINVGSVHGVATSIGIAAYAASKGGLAALTRAAALELASDGIRVNAVLPGAVDTPMLRRSLEGRGAAGPVPSLDELGQRIPLGRVATPAEIAHAILFLADADRSSYITGQALAVDGGVLARLSSE